MRKITKSTYIVTILPLLVISLASCLIIHIDEELNNPFQLKVEGAKDTLQFGEKMTITVTVVDENGREVQPDTYEWYLQGTKLDENTNTITIGDNLEPSTYILDIIVVKGEILSSATITFTVLEP